MYPYELTKKVEIEIIMLISMKATNSSKAAC